MLFYGAFLGVKSTNSARQAAALRLPELVRILLP